MKLLTHLRLLPLRLGHPCLLRFCSAVTTRMDNSNEYFFFSAANTMIIYLIQTSLTETDRLKLLGTTDLTVGHSLLTGHDLTA